jgi:hypothetical protein
LKVPHDATTLAHKAVLDAMLPKISGVSAGDMSGLPAYFVAKKMFACIANGGVGIRLPVAEAANLTFSRGDVVQFQPKGMPSNREWVQINHADSKDYEKDLEVFKASIEFVRSSRN